MITKEDIEDTMNWNRVQIRACYGNGQKIAAKLIPSKNNVYAVVYEPPPQGCRQELKISYALALQILNDPNVPPLYMGE